MNTKTQQVTVSNKKTVSVIDNQGGADTHAKRSVNDAARLIELISSKDPAKVEQAFKILSEECKKDTPHSKSFHYRG
jgi:hypothetical protein